MGAGGGSATGGCGVDSCGIDSCVTGAGSGAGSGFSSIQSSALSMQTSTGMRSQVHCPVSSGSKPYLVAGRRRQPAAVLPDRGRCQPLLPIHEDLFGYAITSEVQL